MPSSKAPEVLRELRIVDADTHITEPHDMWTSRAPKGFEDRVPRVVNGDDGPQWVVDGAVLGRAGASGVVTKDGERSRGTDFIDWTFDDITPAAYDVRARLELMDRLGVWAHIIYPNTAGFGGQRFGAIADPTLKLLCATLYNDAMAELQEASGQRLFPMGLIPWWDIDASVNEVRRMHALGLRGVNTTSDPQEAGLPDFSDRAWDPLWETCAGLDMPVNFHIGAAHDSLSWFGSSPWPGLGPDQKLAVGSAMMYLTNARVLANFIYSGVLERHPRLKIVSVESGIGWIPFFLEALEHQLGETTPGSMDYLTLSPAEYFRRQIHACFWFENDDIAHTIDRVGPENVLFETDFPHPTCLYPDSLDIVGAAVSQLAPGVVRGVMQDNAARLYKLPLPS
ncbi:amidohydrolase family protein [Actinomadura kijaniata]|uniref:Putative TIM-barrel fold metal-dependent hydrolase n=1 Tax=Actinomadura namibiensis TaxID=182080 RepID=A0A7W3M027_ACTNM|nr:amidohydrolase family protein [Actinomadura namibiensis]MBA8957345.1 putative TIM-barrel fold metal-dependent hydrolase [Actinomadura namibiensis]